MCFTFVLNLLEQVLSLNVQSHHKPSALSSNDAFRALVVGSSRRKHLNCRGCVDVACLIQYNKILLFLIAITSQSCLVPNARASCLGLRPTLLLRLAQLSKLTPDVSSTTPFESESSPEEALPTTSSFAH